MTATVISLLVTWLVLDSIKARVASAVATAGARSPHAAALTRPVAAARARHQVLALFVTGPHLILKLPEGPARAVVRKGLRPIHKPLAVLFV